MKILDAAFFLDAQIQTLLQEENRMLFFKTEARNEWSLRYCHSK